MHSLHELAEAYPRNTGGACTSTLNMLCRAMVELGGSAASDCCILISAASAPRGPYPHSVCPKQSARSWPGHIIGVNLSFWPCRLA